MDFNNEGPQRSFDPIPADTILEVNLRIRPGGFGEGGWFKRSKSGDSAALDCELTVIAGEHRGRKIFDLMTLEGTTEGHAQAAEISRRKLRAILESVRGVHPGDSSEAAAKARRLDSWADLDNVRFVVKVGVEAAKNGFAAKNFIKVVVTPEQQAWRQLEQEQRPAAGGNVTQAAKPATTPAAIARPSWAG
jgi:hypothetical protein